MSNRFLRTAALIGDNNLRKLQSSSVAVFGIGGVGSYCAEALIRSGIGKLYVFDNDTVSLSNINRQLIADDSTVGRLKTEVFAERAKKINPQAEIYENAIFVTPQSSIDFTQFDFIVDAIDNVTAKLFLIESSKKHNIPIISVMGTGNKLDPTRLTISDISKTHTCPLAKVIRLELKKRDIKKVDVIWSDELPISQQNCTEQKANLRPAPSSMTFVPSSAGILAASYTIKNILEIK